MRYDDIKDKTRPLYPDLPPMPIHDRAAQFSPFAALVGYGIRLWMFVTPVVYPLSQLSPGLFRNAVRLNPVTAPVELFRLALLGSGTAEPVSLASAAACLFLIPAAGVAVFRRVERTFVDSV